MTATGRSERGGEGRDLFPTPAACALACVRLLPLLGRVLEPSAGPGRFVRAVREAHPGVEIHANELSPLHRGELIEAGAASVRIGDFLTMGARPAERGWDAIVGNPPYQDAAAHIEHALFLVRPGGLVAFVMRAGFLHPVLRRPLRRGLSRTYGLEERPGFEAESGSLETDATEYALIVWRRGSRGPVIADYLSWRSDRTEADIARIVANEARMGALEAA